jgi:hypothetical protein
MITTEQARAFFGHHVSGQSMPYREQVLLKCPLHDDNKASLSVNFKEGVWNCQAGCGKGGMIDFEMAISKCDAETAKANIATIVGSDLFHKGEQAEAIYQYRDAQGIVLFEKLRYPGKQFRQRRPVGKGYEYNLHGVNKPLYNLPEVVTSGAVCICEGEKDADNINAALAEVKSERIDRCIATTNFDGAGKWLDQYNPYFAGKKVFIFPDNDELGLRHAEHVARAVQPYAIGVRIVKLPGLPDKGDVSNYLESHSIQELFAEMKAAPQWYPPKLEQTLFVQAPQFVAMMPEQIEWLVDGIIERGANGTFTAVPKAGKSWAALDLAIAMVLGEPWLGFEIPHPLRVGFVSREDNPRLTSWRLGHLYRGRYAAHPGLIENLYVNTRMQSPQLMIDDDEQLKELVDALSVFKPDFLFFDVFNVIHTAEENDNSEMRAVLRKISSIQEQIHCGIGLVHHYGKGEGSMTQRLRGASAIAGWMEWLIGIDMQDGESKLRRMEFELKAAQPPDPITYRIITENETARLQREGTAAVARPKSDYLFPK